MREIKIKTTVFTDASNNAFPGIFGEIIQGLVQNLGTFTELPYTEEQLTDRLEAILDKTAAAEHGSRAQKNARNLERGICDQVLSRCAGSVTERANLATTYEERVSIVNLSKFTLYKPAEPVGEITAPTPNVKMSNALGTIGLSWKADKNVGSWIVQHVAGTDVSPLANWTTLATVTRCKFTATGLSTGYHSFRLVAVSPVGESVPSEGVTEYAK